MEEFWNSILNFLKNVYHFIKPYLVYPDIILTVLDILILTFIIYKLLGYLLKTSAKQVLKGIVVVLVFTWIAELAGFATITWILKKFLGVGFIAVVIIFQPEIRRTLEKFGHFSPIGSKNGGTAPSDASRIVNSIVAVAEDMSARRWGALVVIEKSTSLEDYISSGIKIDASITEELLGNIFTHNAPLHDGAVIVRQDRIIAASCMLPLTQNRFLSSQLGMRHRAAIGITEVTDAVSLVVSEETGYISIAENGKLFRNVDIQRLRERLLEIFTVEVPNKKHIGSGSEEDAGGANDGDEI